MTIQDKMNLDYKNPIAQNLFLLLQNERFKADLEQLNNKYKTEIEELIKDRVGASNLVFGKTGSPKLHEELIKIAKRCPLYSHPQRTILLSLIALALIKPDKVPLILEALGQDKAINTLRQGPQIIIEVNEEGVALIVSFSAFEKKEKVLKLISSRWSEVKQVQKELSRKNNIKQEKLQSFSNFKREWRIYLDKQSLTYDEVVGKHRLNDISSASMIVTRIKKRIDSLYSY